MAWSVFDGMTEGASEDSPRSARFQTSNGKAVLAGLEWADKPDWHVAHALGNGIAKPGEMTCDPALVDSLVSARIVEKGPCKSRELSAAIGTPSPVECCSHSMFEERETGRRNR